MCHCTFFSTNKMIVIVVSICVNEWCHQKMIHGAAIFSCIVRWPTIPGNWNHCICSIASCRVVPKEILHLSFLAYQCLITIDVAKKRSYNFHVLVSFKWCCDASVKMFSNLQSGVFSRICCKSKSHNTKVLDISNEWMIGINLWNHYRVSFGGFSRHPVVKILVLDNGWFFFPKFRGEHFKKQLSMRQFLHSNMLWKPSPPSQKGVNSQKSTTITPKTHLLCQRWTSMSFWSFHEDSFIFFTGMISTDLLVNFFLGLRTARRKCLGFFRVNFSLEKSFTKMEAKNEWKRYFYHKCGIYVKSQGCMFWKQKPGKLSANFQKTSLNLKV